MWKSNPMKTFDLTLRIGGATAVLLALQILWGYLWVAEPFTFRVGLPALSSLLIVLALALVASSSYQQGWKLSGTLFILYFGINDLCTLGDALLFKIGIQPSQAFRLIASELCTALIFIPLLVLILGAWKNSEPEERKPLIARSAAGWAGRIVLGVLLYVVCDFSAGLSVSPFIKDLYAGIQTTRSVSILEMGVFRGLVYVAAGLAVVQGMKGVRGRAAVALGLSFPILAGVAPLLMHSPYLPGYVRIGRGVAVSISNLVYGAILGYILTRKAAPIIETQQAASV